jgi:hypothetical protein
MLALLVDIVGETRSLAQPLHLAQRFLDLFLGHASFPSVAPVVGTCITPAKYMRQLDLIDNG